MADQQRMYDRAGRDLAAAHHELEELRAMLGATPTVLVSPDRQTSTQLPLAEIRSQIREVQTWAVDNKPIAASLLRTRARMAQKTVEPMTAPSPPPAPEPKRQVPSLVIVGLAAALLVVLTAIILITH